MGMVADMARAILDTTAEVTALMGPGVDPHLYKATQGELAQLRRADLVLYNGLHLEGKLNDVFERLARAQPVIAVGDGIPDSLLRSSPDFPGTYDPHIWFDVSLWRRATLALGAEMAARYPARAQYYRTNAHAYADSLQALDTWVRQQLQTLPPEKRVLVTAHDAFGYFGRAYGVEVRGLQGLSTLSEFGLKDVEALVDFLIARRIHAIFVESSIAPRTIEAVVASAQQRGHAISIGGTLYSDALGAPGTPAGTYTGMVRANVSTVVEALK